MRLVIVHINFVTVQFMYFFLKAKYVLKLLSLSARLSVTIKSRHLSKKLRKIAPMNTKMETATIYVNTECNVPGEIKERNYVIQSF